MPPFYSQESDILLLNDSLTFDLDRFLFRNLHLNLLIGMASDRYAGWMGQIDSEERYKGQITRGTHTVAGKTFVEEVLPVGVQ
jgi:hypothetical protein